MTANSIKAYLQDDYNRYLSEVGRMLLMINEWAQRSNFNFSTKELLTGIKLHRVEEKFVYQNYWRAANMQLNMLVAYRVLIKIKPLNENRYYTRPAEELAEEYKKERVPNHTHQAPHIFQMMYWDKRRDL